MWLKYWAEKCISTFCVSSTKMFCLAGFKQTTGSSQECGCNRRGKLKFHPHNAPLKDIHIKLERPFWPWSRRRGVYWIRHRTLAGRAVCRERLMSHASRGAVSDDPLFLSTKASKHAQIDRKPKTSAAGKFLTRPQLPLHDSSVDHENYLSSEIIIKITARRRRKGERGFWTPAKNSGCRGIT